MDKHKREPDVSGTFAGIPTPMDQQDMAATDKISNYVEALMDRLAGIDHEHPDSGHSKEAQAIKHPVKPDNRKH
ncbi:hypothetical protein WMW72_29185 [Paenibacillus filicis]|uniref:Uncharacterized protein n=1 Tax=Paenibacillus filicis TaxID=669464 RepID=A0ABU9DSY1_9BACL